MNNYQFKTPSFDDQHWLAFRQALYHDLDLAFNHQEMKWVETSDDWQAYILYDSSKPIGMLEISLRNVVDGCLTSPVAYLEGIYLIPEYQHKGISNMMLDKVKEWARGKGCSELGSDTELSNVNSQNFHKKAGFKETYRVVQYRMEL